MDINPLQQISEDQWQLPPTGKMRAPVIFYADRPLLEGMDDKVRDQAANVATLPGIVKASYVMPDGHWGYGFPIGGVAAFDADEGGVVSRG
jgi:tRNA-splicing ligase RtcB